ncbi:MAG: cellulose binding domain-containing protein [Gemmataceae bacterium]
MALWQLLSGVSEHIVRRTRKGKQKSGGIRRRWQPTLEMLEPRLAPATGIDTTPAVSYSISNDWGSGFQAGITLTNDQGSPISDWRLAFDFTAQIQSIWNATIVSQQGSQYIVAGVNWNNTIGNNQTVNFGFTASPGGSNLSPSNYVLTWGQEDQGTNASQVAVTFTVNNDWGSGFGASIAIQNTGTTPITSWKLEFDFPRQITSIWNASIASKQGNHYVIQNASWNGHIAPGGTVSFGFNGSPGNLNGAQPTNWIFNNQPLDADPPPAPPPGMSIADSSAIEGDLEDTLMRFTVSLTEPTVEVVTLTYATRDGTALAGSDYIAASGTLTFAPGETTQTIYVTILGDLIHEGDEYFFVTISNVIGATVLRAEARGTIVDNDAAPPVVVPSISISNVTVTEGDLQGTATGYFYTSGNQILDANGTPVRIAGVNWFGLETADFAPHGLWARNWREQMDHMKELGFNTIRLPFSNQLFDPGSVPNAHTYNNPDLAGLTGLEIMDKIIQYAGEIGLRIILDHHRSDAGAGPNGNGLWYTSVYPESRWIADWVMLATRYADNPTVIGADLHNEPHGPATWGTGNLATDWRLAAERAGNAILAANPNWLIFVEGIQHGTTGSYWWGGNLSLAGAYPVRLDVPGRLVYSPHAYPASVYHQSWFNDPNFPDNLPAIWDANWGYLFREGTAPLLLGEFGSKLEHPLDEPWIDKMIAYLSGDLNGDGTSDLDPGQLGISWTWWSWNPNSGDTGGILANDWRTVHTNKLDKLLPVQFEFPEAGDGGSEMTLATFFVTLSEPTTETVTVAYATADGTALAGQDYVATSGILTFAPGETQKSIVVYVLGDLLVEEDETFYVRLSDPTNATIANGKGIATILDNDGTGTFPDLPLLSINNVAVLEGDSGTTTATFTVFLSTPATELVTVQYATMNGTATAGSDYLATNGTLTFAPGETQKSIHVTVLGDTIVEPDETFFVVLSNAQNAQISVSQGRGTILNDDVPPISSAVEFVVQDDWQSGFRADIIIHNQQATALDNWTLSFDFTAEITSIWNARIVSQSGNHYVITHADWNRMIAAGGSVTFGFTATPGNNPAAPTNYVLTGNAGTGGGTGGGTTPAPTGSSAIVLTGVDDANAVTQVTVDQGVTEFTLSVSEQQNPAFQVVTNNSSVVQAIITADGALRIVGLAAGRASLRIEDTVSGSVRYLGIRVRTADGELPGLPDYLALGSVSEDTTTDLNFWQDFQGDDATNKRMDIRYIYLNGGPFNGWRTWSNADGFRAVSYIRESQKLGIVPYFVYYNIPDGGESYFTNLQHIQDLNYMEAYYQDLKRALDLIWSEAPDDHVGMILEPDFLGYLMQNSGLQPDEIMAFTSAAYSSGVLNSAVDPLFPNTVQGLVTSINYTISKYAPNVTFGWQVNLWASPGITTSIPATGLMRLTDTLGIEAGRQAIANEAALIAEYYVAAGVLTYGADFLAIDKYGLDAGAQPGAATNPTGSTWFWNLDHWNNYLLFSKTLHQTAGLPIVLWQIPVGHINSSLAVNPYDPSGQFPELTNTFTRYEDSAPTFFLGDSFLAEGDRFTYFTTNAGGDPKLSVSGNIVTWGSHMQEARDAGIVAILFGAGVGESTDGVGSPPTDGYWWISQVQEYYLDTVML